MPSIAASLLALLGAAAPDPAALEREVAAIERELSSSVVHAITLGQDFSLEGSRGEVFATPERRVRKIEVTLYGETYRQELRVWVRGEPIVMEARHLRYRGGLADPTVVGTDVARFSVAGPRVLRAVDAAGKPLRPQEHDDVLKLLQKVAAFVLDCFAQDPDNLSVECGERLDPVSDPQPADQHPRIAAIKAEFARIQAELGACEVVDFAMPSWELGGTAYRDRQHRLRKLVVDLAPAGGERQHLEIFFAQGDLLFSLREVTAAPGATVDPRTTVSRAYYERGAPIRLLDAKGKRVRLNTESHGVFLFPLVDVLHLLPRCFDGPEVGDPSCPQGVGRAPPR